MNSSSDDDYLAQLQCVAEGTDAVLRNEEHKKKDKKSKRKASKGDGTEGAKDLQGPRLKLRQLLDHRLDELLEATFSDPNADAVEGNTQGDNRHSEGPDGVRLFAKVPKGDPVLLQSQSNLIHEALLRQQHKRRRKRGLRKSDGILEEAQLTSVVIDSEQIVANAKDAAVAAAAKITSPDAEEASSEDLDARKSKQRKKITLALARTVQKPQLAGERRSSQKTHTSIEASIKNHCRKNEKGEMGK